MQFLSSRARPGGPRFKRPAGHPELPWNRGLEVCGDNLPAEPPAGSLPAGSLLAGSLLAGTSPAPAGLPPARPRTHPLDLGSLTLAELRRPPRSTLRRPAHYPARHSANADFVPTQSRTASQNVSRSNGLELVGTGVMMVAVLLLAIMA